VGRGGEVRGFLIALEHCTSYLGQELGQVHFGNLTVCKVVKPCVTLSRA
jgi:hypothetical protein